MTERYWFLQANPKLYDLDGALGELDRIWWRVPQHTSEIHVGDVVLLWRSGKESGIVGIGRVIEEPQMRGIDSADKKFTLSPEEGVEGVTRALVLVKPAPFVAKSQLEVLAPLSLHPIVVAPMGTVFPVSEEQWQAIRPLVSPPPDPVEGSAGVLPSAFGWEQRAKGVLPMPGGYSGYLDSLVEICNIVDEERPKPIELAARLEAQMHLAATAARLRESFLRKAGFIEQSGGVCRVGLWAQRWRESGDPRIAIALLHARCRFIGEMLAEAQTPRTTDELRQIANERYGLKWDTQTQVLNRRGWLQSAGMLEATDDGRIQTTSAGKALLHELTLFRGASTEDAGKPPVGEPGEPVLPTPEEPGIVQRIVDELAASATDSGNPDRFERAVRDAFSFLGFQAEWIGGAGKTDVLVDAPLGAYSSYRSVVDCKTSASGSVNDPQVDWMTLKEHKTKHEANYILLVAPQPSGKRLFERAQETGVAVLSVERLSALCRQHTKAPLGLEDYRALFTVTSEGESAEIDEHAEELLRLIALAATICAAIRQHSQTFGRLTAHDLLLLTTTEPEFSTTEEELQVLLDAMANPLLGIAEGDRETGYLVVMSPAVARDRLAVLGQHLAADLTENTSS
jgi:predicted RNA-binding protein with PUA-like domain